jgi:light-regulated signal transduction histidine kinase (bacteriophytochrome)
MAPDASCAQTKFLPPERFTPDTGLQNLLAELDELRSRIRAEQTNHSKELTQFAYAASHDLREPLRMMASFAQLLNRRYANQLDADGREFLRFIQEGAQTMERRLEDLLSYSLQLRPLENPPSTVDSEAVARGVLMNLEKLISESGAEITHEALPAVQCDFTHLTQVFQHLISNSIRFHGPEPPRIHISATETDGLATFSFSDNGLGIDPRYHEEVFNAFKRLHGREYPGTGVGLAICKRLIEQYGGKIWVESEEGRGAVFLFTLPV